MTRQSCKGDAPDGFLRHIRACHNAVLPGGRLPLLLGATPVGWLDPALVPVLCSTGRARVGKDATAPQAAVLPGAALAEGAPPGGARQVVVDDPASLAPLARLLADAGAFRWRDEAFDVRATPDGPALAQIDRGALPPLGLIGIGVHVNGLVQRADGLCVWVARRAADKALDPGKLDHLVAGGVPAGLSPAQTLVKEAAEEAGLPGALAAGAREVARLAYAMDRPEGLRRDVLVCYDLQLPVEFQPVPADGEVESFALWPIAEVAERLRTTDDFKFNVALVLIDLLLRCGVIDPVGAEGRMLRAALQGG
jgi:8-oxo-dGTP pyrophosphatase MutT (NUDIX family)